MTKIRLTNTKTHRKEVFQPIDRLNVRMYLCGPTVYDRAHLGNARPVVVFDVLYRLLRHVYGPEHVTYVRNFTDVDDKINARAAEMVAAGDARSLVQIIRALTDETIAWYHADMDALGALRPTHEPRATEYIGQMVEMIAALIARGHAYEAEGHVLFDVRSYPEYGALSGRSVDDMIAGARVEVAPYKRDPMDFVLWKPSSDDLPGWDSPWGRGRPGWHIECSAMSDDLLWEKPLQEGRLSEEALKHPHAFDIHAGGIDLQFPHHENEIAQSCCAHKGGEGEYGEFAQVWMHNEMLQVEGKKMSKSLGNFFTVRDLIREYCETFAIENIGPAIRLRLLETHYRSPIDFGRSYIEAAATKLGLWSKWIDENIFGERPANLHVPAELLDALEDDLNTSKAISFIDSLIEQLKRPFPNQSIINERADRDEMIAWQAVVAIEFLGFDLAEIRQLQHSAWSRKLKLREQSRNPKVVALIGDLLEQRASARKTKDFVRADALRDGFSAAGVKVKDTPQGAEWELTADFDPAKLEALK